MTVDPRVALQYRVTECKLDVGGVARRVYALIEEEFPDMTDLSLEENEDGVAVFTNRLDSYVQVYANPDNDDEVHIDIMNYMDGEGYVLETFASLPGVLHGVRAWLTAPFYHYSGDAHTVRLANNLWAAIREEGLLGECCAQTFPDSYAMEWGHLYVHVYRNGKSENVIMVHYIWERDRNSVDTYSTVQNAMVKIRAYL